MIKAIAFIQRKPGISREEFARHYEEVHAPLAVRLIPTMRGYSRDHLVRPLVGEAGFDCITTFRYDALEDAAAVFSLWQSDAGQPFRDDEATFMDTSKNISLIVEEMVTASPKPEERKSLVKAVALLKRKPGLSRQEFIEHYEQIHVPLIMKHTAGVVAYARNYVCAPEGAGEPGFDSMTEIWHQDMAAFEAVLNSRETAGGRAIQEDERTFLDTAAIRFILVNETVSL